MIFGIDPGCSGAIVALNDDGTMHNHMPMPLVLAGKRHRVNGSAVADFFRQYIGQRSTACLELVGPMPGQGVTSMFTFGHSCGVIEGILQAMEIPYQTIRPQAWKKGTGLIGLDKDAARSRAIQLYPTLRVLDLKGKGQAVADAILIARFGHGLQCN